MEDNSNYKGLYMTLGIVLTIFFLIIVYFAYYYYSINKPTEVVICYAENNILLYNGDKISIDPGIHSYGYSINVNDSGMKEKYDNITYYNYENNEYMGTTIGKLEGFLGDEEGEFYGVVSNISRIASLNELNAFPRDIIESREIEEKQLKDYSIAYKVDLDGDGKIEYLCIQYGNLIPVEQDEIENDIYTVKYVTKVDLLDENYNLINNLITFTDYKTEAEKNNTPIYLENIDIMDIDRDDIMEILIDLYGYEESGKVAIYKYDGSQVQGEINYKSNILP